MPSRRFKEQRAGDRSTGADLVANRRARSACLTSCWKRDLYRLAGDAAGAPPTEGGRPVSRRRRSGISPVTAGPRGLTRSLDVKVRSRSQQSSGEIRIRARSRGGSTGYLHVERVPGEGDMGSLAIKELDSLIEAGGEAGGPDNLKPPVPGRDQPDRGWVAGIAGQSPDDRIIRADAVASDFHGFVRTEVNGGMHSTRPLRLSSAD
jgi:hypothetical protein